MLFTQTKRHLGTDIEIQIVSDKVETASVIEDIFHYCADFESEFSRFRPKSSLSQLNKEKELVVSERFKKLFETALLYKNETKGLFSPFVNLNKIGYSQSFESGIFSKIKENTPLEADYMFEGNVIKLSSSTQVDFGGIGKGFLVDTLTSFLEEKGYTDFCINAGGDIRVKGESPENFPWGIGVENPINRETCAVFYCNNNAINTSGSYRRKWSLKGEDYHHIINPLTGKNTNYYLSVTVITESSTKADALTKVLWHTKKEKIKDFFEEFGVDGFVIDINNQYFLSKNMKDQYFFRYL